MPRHMARFVLRHNPDFDPQIAREFIRAGSRYGIRGDIAFCQAIVETGWFKYTGGTAVTADSHNYCGLGVTSKGRKGANSPLWRRCDGTYTASLCLLYH